MASNAIAPHSAVDRVTAAELVDYFLYWYAILHFLRVTVFSGAFAINGSVSLTAGLVISFFVFVLLRNYLVMHAIDTAEHRTNTSLDFMSGNERISGFLERLMRFAIMLTVIATPKGAFDWANEGINWLVETLTSLFLAVYRTSGLPHNLPADSVVHGALPV